MGLAGTHRYGCRDMDPESWVFVAGPTGMDGETTGMDAKI